ncbi:MAG TPA: type II toxin-antitoxin system RelE/ParE family toxin [Pirellulales bacterium]|nr:type II toxin-antitoxin system RelE/ParE family toxin [Pirellulales bacterium]
MSSHRWRRTTSRKYLNLLRGTSLRPPSAGCRRYLRLAKNPEIGERRPEFKTGEFRSSLIGRYVIFYRPTADGIEVARIVRGERDIRNL